MPTFSAWYSYLVDKVGYLCRLQLIASVYQAMVSSFTLPSDYTSSQVQIQEATRMEESYRQVIQRMDAKYVKVVQNGCSDSY